MEPPDRRMFEADLQSAAYRNGAAKGLWGRVVGDSLPADTVWPIVLFWLTAAPRPTAPDRYYVALNLAGYRSVPPTGPLWDPVTKQRLDLTKWPKGKPGSRFAQVFRTSGFSFEGRALYHPYDRSPLSDHPAWKDEQPHLIWTSSHTIVDYLEEIQSLLMSGDYVGV